jgi:glycosyltransferase involved in cell wall biosynthesis
MLTLNRMEPAASLIVSTYNWPQALELVLISIMKQTKMPLEVIIADDGSGITTRQLIDDYQKNFPVPLKHVWHEDLGFRKTIILNESVRQSKGNYIIQIDGDIILHPKFIEDHIKYAKPGYFIKGSRGMLSKNKTLSILESKHISISPFQSGLGSKINATRFPVMCPVFFGNPSLTRNVKGCNFAFWKNNFIEVNGYDNSMEGWGHEDIEIAARLVNIGIKCRHLKMVAVCYHLHHKLNSRHQQKSNFLVYERVVKEHIKFCENGYAMLNGRRILA